MMTQNIPVQIASQYGSSVGSMFNRQPMHTVAQGNGLGGLSPYATPRFIPTTGVAQQGWSTGLSPLGFDRALPLSADKTALGFGSKTASLMHREVFTPAADILENNVEVVVLADLPGVDPQSVNIHIANNQLIIQALRKDCIVGKQDVVYEFYRAFELGAGIDITAIKAEFQTGVLRICLPKTGAYQRQPLQVRTVSL